MHPVIVSTMVDRDPDQVYAFLDVLANHERIDDHLMVGWSYEGPPTGLGARATANIKLAGRRGPVEIEVIETTVAQPIYEMGRQGMENILLRIQDPQMEASEILFETRLTIRQSTAKRPVRKTLTRSNR